METLVKAEVVEDLKTLSGETQEELQRLIIHYSHHNRFANTYLKYYEMLNSSLTDKQLNKLGFFSIGEDENREELKEQYKKWYNSEFEEKYRAEVALQALGLLAL